MIYIYGAYEHWSVKQAHEVQCTNYSIYQWRFHPNEYRYVWKQSVSLKSLLGGKRTL